MMVGVMVVLMMVVVVVMVVDARVQTFIGALEIDAVVRGYIEVNDYLLLTCDFLT